MSASNPTSVIGEPQSHQGLWTEAEYLAIPGNRLVEFIDGVVEVLPMPTIPHQWILSLLNDALKDFVRQRQLGWVQFAPLPVKVRSGRYREPDLFFIASQNRHRLQGEYCDGAELVIEILSEDRKRDLVDKRLDYAESGIPEYWIVDPRDERITVLRLEGDQYVVHGEFTGDQMATSVLLPGFVVRTSEVFAAGKLPE